MVDSSDSAKFWYGLDPCFWYPMERDARRYMKEEVSVELAVEQRVYRVHGLRIPGDREAHDLRVEFHRVPPYATYGLAPMDYPRVFTSVFRQRKHAFPDTALCLWFPGDPEEARWVHKMGLRILIEMTRRQLLFELEYAITGRWPMEDAPHDFPKPRKASGE